MGEAEGETSKSFSESVNMSLSLNVPSLDVIRSIWFRAASDKDLKDRNAQIVPACPPSS